GLTGTGEVIRTVAGFGVSSTGMTSIGPALVPGSSFVPAFSAAGGVALSKGSFGIGAGVVSTGAGVTGPHFTPGIRGLPAVMVFLSPGFTSGMGDTGGTTSDGPSLEPRGGSGWPFTGSPLPVVVGVSLPGGGGSTSVPGIGAGVVRPLGFSSKGGGLPLPFS